MRTIKVVRINTTAYEEEDFFLMTDLTEQEIDEVLTPIVELERNEIQEYDNDMLVENLELAYPSAFIKVYTEFKTITICLFIRSFYRSMHQALSIRYQMDNHKNHDDHRQQLVQLHQKPILACSILYVKVKNKLTINN